MANGSAWQWTAKRDAVASALAEGKTWKATAEAVGVGTTTIARWMKAPEFTARIDDLQAEMVAEARRILRRNATAAAQQLVNLVRHGHSLHSVKLAAAKDVLDRVGLKATEKHEYTGTDGAALTIRWVYGDEDGDG